MIDYSLLAKQLKSICETAKNHISVLSNASALIFNNLEKINWAGFYLIEDSSLILGPFQGQVACNDIPYGKGVCGTAWEKKETVRIDDVHKIDNHIACDANSKSEIVIPIFVNKKMIGVLDIDSPITSRFSNSDKDGLELFVSTIEEILSPMLLSH